MATSEERKVARFDGGGMGRFADVWTRRGGFCVVVRSPFPLPTRGERIDTFYVDTMEEALALAASKAQELIACAT
jgi:hypothetical protein